MAGCNQTRGVPVDPVRERFAFTQLPPRVRAVLAAAPYDFNSIVVLAEWTRARKAGWSEAAFAQATMRALAADAARETRIVWGKDHPCVERFRAIAAGRAYPPVRAQSPGPSPAPSGHPLPVSAQRGADGAREGLRP